MANTEALHSVGIAYQQPGDLAALVPNLMERDDLWTAQPEPYESWRGLTERQREAWGGLGPWLVESCHQLAEFVDHSRVQLSITHGDFHPGNVLQQDGRVLIHDWANALITHPFVDLGTWIDDMTEGGARLHLDAYLSAWTHLAEPGDLAAMWRAAKPVSGLVALDRAIRQTDEFGRVHRHAMIAVIYGWVRRLLGAATDPNARIANWPTSP